MSWNLLAASAAEYRKRRPPAGRTLAVAAVLLAEPGSQTWLFVEPDIDGVDGDEADEPPRERRRAQYQRLAGENEKQAGFHRIAAVAIGARADELARGIPRAPACRAHGARTARCNA